MILNFKSNKSQTTASAKVVDGKLILSMPDAITPVVWQMDLAQAKASALEVLHNETKGIYTLTVKTPKGETIDVAAFNTRAEAVEGLMAASAALENAHGQIRGGQATSGGIANDAPTKKIKKNLTPAQKKQKRNRWLTSVLALVILFILLSVWSSVTPRIITTGAPETVASSGTSPQESTGVAVSADDFLNAQ